MPRTEPTRAASGGQRRVLLIDDDAELGGMIRKFLAPFGLDVSCATNGRDGLRRAIDGGADLVLLDVTMPLLDGFSLLHQLRRSSDVPVLMLTSRSTATDRLTGLNGGADDYLCKPFDPDELLARIHAVLRRTGPDRSADWLQSGTIRISLQHRQALVDGRNVALTATELELLYLLCRSAGKAVFRDALTLAVQDRQPDPFDRSLDVHISHLRAKLGTAGERIRTIRGTGYLLAAGTVASP